MLPAANTRWWRGGGQPGCRQRRSAAGPRSAPAASLDRPWFWTDASIRVVGPVREAAAFQASCGRAAAASVACDGCPAAAADRCHGSRRRDRRTAGNARSAGRSPAHGPGDRPHFGAGGQVCPGSGHPYSIVVQRRAGLTRREGKEVSVAVTESCLRAGTSRHGRTPLLRDAWPQLLSRRPPPVYAPPAAARPWRRQRWGGDGFGGADHRRHQL